MFRQICFPIVVAAPRIAVVDIERVAVTVQVPEAGNRDFAPGGIVIADGLEALQPAFDSRVEVEFPQAVQAQSLLLGRDEGRPHGQSVFLEDIRVLPGFHLGLRHEGQRGSHQGQG